MSSRVHYQETICAALGGEPIRWAYANDAVVYRGFVRWANYHGVAALLYYALKRSGSLSSWPVELVQRLRAGAIDAAAGEAIRARELARVLRELARAGVYPLLLKGTPLAYSLYSEPALRQRSDTDLLIRQIDRDSLSQLLVRLGYLHSQGVTGDLVSSQSTFSRLDQLGISHDLDVHWRISNFHLFGDALSYEELASRAIPVAPLGTDARTLHPIDALILACMHRLGHQQAPYYVDGEAHYDSNRLIWLYDIHLLAQSLTAEQWGDFTRAAMAKRLPLLCLDGLNAAKQVFRTLIPAVVAETFVQAPKGEVIDVGRFQVPRWRWELAEIYALPTWSGRLKLVKEHLVPSPDYLRQKYDVSDRRGLSLLYLRRALAGIWKRL